MEFLFHVDDMKVTEGRHQGFSRAIEIDNKRLMEVDKAHRRCSGGSALCWRKQQGFPAASAANVRKFLRRAGKPGSS